MMQKLNMLYIRSTLDLLASERLLKTTEFLKESYGAEKKT